MIVKFVWSVLIAILFLGCGTQNFRVNDLPVKSGEVKKPVIYYNCRVESEVAVGQAKNYNEEFAQFLAFYKCFFGTPEGIECKFVYCKVEMLKR